VYRSHLETDHQILSGCREDVLRKVNGAWKVARRTIVLDVGNASQTRPAALPNVPGEKQHPPHSHRR
jgi:hypothetical protein